jgi:hypothetical protein
MDSPNTRDAEPPSGQAPGLSSAPQLQPQSTPHYIVAAQDITTDRDSRLGTSKRSSSVFKGFWNNSLVAVKILSNEAPTDVSRIYLYFSNMISHG